MYYSKLFKCNEMKIVLRKQKKRKQTKNMKLKTN